MLAVACEPRLVERIRMAGSLPGQCWQSLWRWLAATASGASAAPAAPASPACLSRSELPPRCQQQAPSLSGHQSAITTPAQHAAAARENPHNPPVLHQNKNNRQSISTAHTANGHARDLWRARPTLATGQKPCTQSQVCAARSTRTAAGNKNGQEHTATVKTVTKWWIDAAHTTAAVAVECGLCWLWKNMAPWTQV